MKDNIEKQIRESSFYIHYKELLKNILESYNSPEEYYLDKLNDDDLDKITIELLDDNYFNNLVDSCLKENLESYAARKESRDNPELGRFEE